MLNSLLKTKSLLTVCSELVQDSKAERSVQISAFVFKIQKKYEKHILIQKYIF